MHMFNDDPFTSQTYPDNSAAATLLTDVLLADAHLVAWHAALPTSWRPTTDPTYTTVSDMPRQHSYTSILTATMLNHYRVFRLLALGIAMRCLADQTPSLQNCMQDAQIRRTIGECVNDICASVAWFLGPGFGRACADVGEADARAYHRDSGDEADAGGAYYLIWPLFVAMSVDCIPGSQRSWIKERMAEIGKDFGYRQASAAAGGCC